MSQRFVARERFEFPNGAIGWRPGGPFDCLGPYAKVQKCPVYKYVYGPYSSVKEIVCYGRYTCYASGYADTMFSIPANTRMHGKHVRGYFTHNDTGGIEFRIIAGE